MDGNAIASAKQARAHFGKLLQLIEGEGRLFVIARRGTPQAVLLSIRDYVRLAVPEPEILRLIGNDTRDNAEPISGTKHISAGSSRLRVSQNGCGPGLMSASILESCIGSSAILSAKICPSDFGLKPLRKKTLLRPAFPNCRTALRLCSKLPVCSSRS